MELDNKRSCYSVCACLFPFCDQDREVFIHEKRSNQQETLWNPGPDVRSSRLKRQVVPLDQQGEFESER